MPDFATPWPAACQAPPSMGFSRQKYWSGLPLPSPSDGYIFPFLLCLSLLFFSQLFVRPPQTTILPFCISFFGGWSQDTHSKSWVSLLWGHFSFLLGPDAHMVPSQSLFPESCVRSGSCIVGLMATSSKRAYAIPRSVPRAPAPAAGHC